MAGRHVLIVALVLLGAVSCGTKELDRSGGESTRPDTGDDWTYEDTWDDEWDDEWEPDGGYLPFDAADGDSDDLPPQDSGAADVDDPQPDAPDDVDVPELDPVYSPNPADCHPRRNRYNCKPPVNGDNLPRMTNPHTGDIYWPLAVTTELMDGYGNARGTIESSRVKVNAGMRKVLHGQTAVYVWAVKLTSGIYASGWIFEDNLQHAADLRRDMPTVWLPNPKRGHYVTQWTITGGDNTEWEDLTVTKGHSGGGRRATDYLLRPGNVVNLIFNVPGREMGGYSVDTIPPGGTFRRARGVLQDEIPVYNLGGTTPVKMMKYVYGYFHDGSQRRYGWIAKAALESAGQLPSETCEVTCCDGEVKSFAATSQAECREAYGWCAGHGAVRDMVYAGSNIYHRTESCTQASYCCALCNDRSAYHRVEGVDWACTDAASTYCSQGTRGGLDDADWRYCTP